MKRTLVVVAVLFLAALAGPASAVICSIDDVPGATLLLPKFEVDLNDPAGLTTLFSINNASATAILAHVVVWSDLSVPVLDFNIYLTGYDVQTINMRDILNSGIVPRTASAGQDPGDLISHKGIFSQDINFASCAGQLPPPILPASFIDHLQKSLTGQPSPILGGRCASTVHTSAIGYVTVDTVNNCTLRFPGDAGYFVSGGNGDATNQNVLWGDYFYVNSNPTTGNYASGETLVHIEAAPGFGTSATDGNYGPSPETSIAGQYTFYGRYVAWTAADNREPLSTNFSTRFVNGGVQALNTNLTAWRDSKVNQGPFTCGTQPSWYPLGQEGIVIFDEQENPVTPSSFPFSPQPPSLTPSPFPAETQTVNTTSSAFASPFSSGWMYLNLNTTVAPAGSNPPEDPAAAQAWVETEMFAEGRFNVGYDAIKLDSACRAHHGIPQ